MFDILARGLKHQPLTVNERLVYHYCFSVLFFIVTLIVTNIFDWIVIQGYAIGDATFWQTNIPTLFYGVVMIVLYSLKKYYSVKGDAQMGYIVTSLELAERAMAKTQGITIPVINAPEFEQTQEEKGHE